MAHIKTTFALSVLAHAVVLASFGLVAPNGLKLAQEPFTPVELVTFERGEQKVEAATQKKDEQVKNEIKPAEAAMPAQAPSRDIVEDVRKEAAPVPEVSASTPAPRSAAVAEPSAVHRHIEASSPAVEAATEPRPAKTSHDREAAFNSYVIRKIDRSKLYPNWARQRGYEGNVRVRFNLSPDGSVSAIKVVAPCECDILNKAACEAIQRAAPFNDRPAFEDGTRVMEVNIGFRLKK